MSERNIQVVKEGFERFLAGDIPGFLDLVADDIYWDHRGPEGVPFNRLYEGREAVAEFFKVFNETEEAIVFEPREYFGAGDRVVCVGFCRFCFVFSHCLQIGGPRTCAGASSPQ